MSSISGAPALPNPNNTAEALRLQNARLAALQQVVLGLTSTLELGVVLQRVAEMAQTLAASAHAHIFLYDASRDELTLAASHWSVDQTPIPLKPRRFGITYSVARSGEPIFIEDSTDHPYYADVPRNARPGALACLPLVKGEGILGTLNLGYWHPYHFDPETRAFLDLMAKHAAIAIDNARLYQAATLSASELRRLYDTSLDITSQLEISKLLDLIIQRAAELLNGDSGNFYFYDENADELVPRAPFGQHTVESVARLKPGEGATGQVFLSGQPLVIQDYDAWEGRVPRIPFGRYARILHVPVKRGEQVIGVMSVNRNKAAPAYTDDDVRLLSLFANQAAIAIENARLYQVAIEKARMERELDMARALQSTLIPRELPQIVGWDLAALWRPAREVSGDFYDFVLLPTAPRRHGLMIADVSDKGLPAALFMTATRAILRASVTASRSPANCIAHANRLICADTANGMFITLCYAQLNPTNGEMVYVNAGHNPPLLYRKRKNQLSALTQTGMALGVEEKCAFHQRTIKLNHGDFVLFYTDGVTEAINAAEEEFGEERLRQVILKKRHAPATEMIAALEKAVSAFVGETPQSDDIAVVIVKRL
jgi:serine phosphatase RsbU (regulator of sigma subunit)